MATIARDIPYGSAPFQTQAPEYEFPFLMNKDATSFIVTRFYKQTVDDYNADKLAARYLPGITLDPVHPVCYLMTESKATRTQTAMVAFSRTYARVPTEQIDYSTLAINKPAFPTNDYNSAWVDSTSATATANVWSAALASTVSKYASGGTFTITYVANFGSGISSTTAALNWNDSNATIKAALEALASSIADGNTYTVTGSISTGLLTIDRAGGGIWNGSQFSTNSASLTPGVVSAVGGGSAQAILYYARTAFNFNRLSHGLAAGQSIRINTGTTGGGTATTVASVIDADNFTVINSSVQPSAWAYYRTLMRTYTPGVDRVVTRLRSSFYLPGITPQIDSPQYIPVPDVAINDTNLLTLITNSATGFQTYDASDLTHWPTADSPIYTQTIKEINVDNL